MAGLRTEELLLVESRVSNRGPSIGVAYLLWVLGGLFGFHRFYLRRPVSGILMTLTLGFLGVWAFVDLFLIPGMVASRREKIREEEMGRIMAARPVDAAPAQKASLSDDQKLIEEILAKKRQA